MYLSSQQPSLLKVAMTLAPPCLFVSLSGELDVCSVKEVPHDPCPADPDVMAVLLDLGGLTFCDLTGLRGLLTFARYQRGQGRTVEIVHANPAVRRLRLMCQVTDSLECPHFADAVV